MAIYSLNLGFVARSEGRSAVGFSAYIAATRQEDLRTGIVYNYDCKSDVLMSRVLAPEHAPEWAKNPFTLWNKVDQFEDLMACLRFRGDAHDPDKNQKSLDARERFINTAQTAQTIMGAIPYEFSQEEAEACIEEFLKERFVSRDLVVQYATHWKSGNPHFHGMITRRPLIDGEFSGRKDHEIVTKEELLVTRKLWETVANKHLELGGHEVRIDSRSHADRGSLFLPTEHEGYYAQQLVEQGQYSRIVADNEVIRQQNIKILCENPAAVIQEVASKRTTFTRKHIEDEIIRRVGGDEKLFAVLKAKVDDLELPAEMVLKGANDNKVFEGVFASELRGLAEKLTDRLLTDKEITHTVGENINRNPIFASAAHKKQEEKMIETGDALHGRQTKTVPEELIQVAIKNREAELGNELSSEQQAAITHLCSGPDIRILNGKAGTGKTTLLKAVAEAYEKSGYQVIGTSFQGKAVEIMEQEIGIPCKTLDSFRCAWEKEEQQKEFMKRFQSCFPIQGGSRAYYYAYHRAKEFEPQRFTNKNVIIVDEANMIGGHLWDVFLKEATDKGAKVLIVQDPAQIKSREPGDYGRLLAERFGFCETSEVVRQRIPWQRECSKLLNDYQVLDGLKPYYDKGHLKWFENSAQVHQALAQDYVKDFIENPHKSRIALGYRNTEVYELNQVIREGLKEHGYLQDSFKINGEDYAIGDQIRFLENENHGRYVQNFKTVKGQPKGVKNGTFGIIEAYDTEKNLFTVRLEKGRRIQFNPEDYRHFTYGYAMGIHKSEGSTFDKSFVSPDPLIDPTTLLVAMTRHRDDVHVYINREQFIDFKDLIEQIGKVLVKENLQDYSISEEERPYFERVQQYRDLMVEAVTLREEMEGDLESTVPLYKQALYPVYQSYYEEKKRVAEAILQDWQNHVPFLRLIGIRKDVLEVEAGLRPRLLSDLECRASIQVEGYVDLVNKTRTLWKEISETHPGTLAQSHALYEDYKALKTERDSLAAAFQENLKLYTPFFRVTKDEAGELTNYWGEQITPETRVYISALKSHAEAHHQSQLQNLYYEKLTPEQKGHYDVVKSYITARNESAALYSHLQKQKEEPLHMTSPETFLTIEKFHELQGKRDSLALKIIESPEKYQEFFEKFKVKEGKLLEHAVAGEIREKLQTYATETDISKRASQAQELKHILTTSKDYRLFKESGLDFNRLIFDIAFYDKVKRREISAATHPDQIYKPIQNYLHTSREAARLWKMVQLKDQENIETLKKDWELSLQARNENAQRLVNDQVALSVISGMRQGIQSRVIQHAGVIERKVSDETPTKAFISAEQVLAAAKGNYDSIAMGLFGQPNQHMSKKTELRFGNKGSLSIDINSEKGYWRDYETGESGNIFTLIQREKSLNFKESIAYLADILNVGLDSPLISSPKVSRQKESSVDKAKEIASLLNSLSELEMKSQPLNGTLAETYLRQERGIKGELSPDLRYLPRGTTFMYRAEWKTITYPCLAAFGHNHEGRLSSVQMTRLNDQGKRALNSEGDKLNKLQYGLAGGSFVLLQEGQNSDRVFIAEGVETALSIKEANVIGKIVASMGIHNISNYQGPEKEIILCADNDDHKASSKTFETIEKAQAQFTAQEKSVSIIKPSQSGDDFNDVLKKEGKKGVQEYVTPYLDPHPKIHESTPHFRNQEVPQETKTPMNPAPEPNSIESISQYLNSAIKEMKAFEGSYLADKARQELKAYMETLRKNERTLEAVKAHDQDLAKELHHFEQSQSFDKERGMEM